MNYPTIETSEFTIPVDLTENTDNEGDDLEIIDENVEKYVTGSENAEENLSELLLNFANDKQYSFSNASNNSQDNGDNSMKKNGFQKEDHRKDQKESKTTKATSTSLQRNPSREQPKKPGTRSKVTSAAKKKNGQRSTMSPSEDINIDPIYSFLKLHGMTITLESYVKESELIKKRRGNISRKYQPDIYIKNELLSLENEKLNRDILEIQQKVTLFKDALSKSKKERDFHKMHYNREVVTRKKLMNELKLLHKHCKLYEPIIDGYKKRYERLMKQKTLVTFERDRLLRKAGEESPNSASIEANPSNSKLCAKNQSKKKGSSKTTIFHGIQLEKQNPMEATDSDFNAGSEAFDFSGWQLKHQITVSAAPTGCVSPNPKKELVVASSDLGDWKVISIDTGEVVVSNSDANDETWIACSCFHPGGGYMAVTSNNSVKLWDFFNGRLMNTFIPHHNLVWWCDFHHSGNLLACSSADQTISISDVQTSQVRTTLRGHSDSVNCVKFMPYSGLLCSCSSDKTICYWDLRSNQPLIHTFYGHHNACFEVDMDPKGEIVASCDGDSEVKLWDISTRRLLSSTCLLKVEEGEYGQKCNSIAIERSGRYISSICDNGKVFIHSISDHSVHKVFELDENSAPQSVCFTHDNKNLVVSGRDGKVRVWSQYETYLN